MIHHYFGCLHYNYRCVPTECMGIPPCHLHSWHSAINLLLYSMFLQVPLYACITVWQHWLAWPLWSLLLSCTLQAYQYSLAHTSASLLEQVARVYRQRKAGRQTGHSGRSIDTRKHISEILRKSLFVGELLTPSGASVPDPSRLEPPFRSRRAPVFTPSTTQEG